MPPFLREVVRAFPYAIHTVLTDNGVQFTPRKQDIWDSDHIFDRICSEHDIEHRLTKPYHPWTNGQAERMNRTIKDATTKAFHYPDLDALKAHVLAFVTARYGDYVLLRPPFRAGTLALRFGPVMVLLAAIAGVVLRWRHRRAAEAVPLSAEEDLRLALLLDKETTP